MRSEEEHLAASILFGQSRGSRSDAASTADGQINRQSAPEMPLARLPVSRAGRHLLQQCSNSFSALTRLVRACLRTDEIMVLR